MTDKLKPCPHCGGTNIEISSCKGLEECENFEECYCAEFYSVVCDFNKGGCGTSSGYRRTAEQAIEAWNCRVSGWIPVMERLPDYNTPVLVCANQRIYTATLFKCESVEWWAVNNRGNRDGNDAETKIERVNAKAIKYWRSLPEPPKGE